MGTPTPDGHNWWFRGGQRQPKKNRASLSAQKQSGVYFQPSGNPKRKSRIGGLTQWLGMKRMKETAPAEVVGCVPVGILDAKTEILVDSRALTGEGIHYKWRDR